MEQDAVDSFINSYFLFPNEALYSMFFIGIITFVFFAWLSTRVSSEFRVIPATAENNEIQTNNELNLSTEPRPNEEEVVVDSDYTDPNFSESETSVCSDEGISNLSNRRLKNVPKPNRVPVKELSINRQLLHAKKYKDSGHIVLKLQFLDDKVFYVHADPSMYVWHFKLKYFRKEIQHENKKVRLIYRGHELVEYKNERTHLDIQRMMKLSDYSLTQESIIHCLITNNPNGPGNMFPNSRPQSSSTTNVGQPRNTNPSSIHFHDAIVGDFDFGSRFLMPIACLLLSSSWLLRIAYRQYFSLLSTMALVGLTMIFAVFTFAMGLLRFQSGETTVVIRNQSSNISEVENSTDNNSPPSSDESH